MTPAWQILRYHEATKHHYQRYAASPDFLDWATQPNPFRTYEGAPTLLLPLLKKDPTGSHLDLYERAHNPFWDFGLESVAAFLELSMGLSAWKETSDGARWALRMNPSSGNLHPTELYLVLPSLDPPSRLNVLQKRHASPILPLSENMGSDGGLYHYNPYLHALERRVKLPHSYVDRLRSHFQSAGFLVGLTSIPWRESWKYGERALRYCHHDIGHALAALSFAAGLLGWKVTYLGALSDQHARRALALEGVVWPSLEEEDVALLAYVSPAGPMAVPRSLPTDWLAALDALPRLGRPSSLSPDHREWPLIENTRSSLDKPRSPEFSVRFETSHLLRAPTSGKGAAALIRSRRSAVAFDGETSPSRAQFYALLDKTLPRNAVAPFDVELGRPQIHLLLFVHRVVDLVPGLYCLMRDSANEAELKRSFRRDFVWEKVESPLPLYRLAEGDYRATAVRVSCHQEIAGRGAFAVAMISRFHVVLERDPWRYKTLFWEAGLIGQALYLEAEAQGLRGTGIGCFFDDPVHEILGLQNDAYQSLYHFSIGGPVEDSRLSTHHPYAHLPRDRW